MGARDPRTPYPHPASGTLSQLVPLSAENRDAPDTQDGDHPSAGRVECPGLLPVEARLAAILARGHWTRRSSVVEAVGHLSPQHGLKYCFR